MQGVFYLWDHILYLFVRDTEFWAKVQKLIETKVILEVKSLRITYIFPAKFYKNLGQGLVK